MTGGSADDRGRSSQPGIESWHCFSSGPYYDPTRMSFGPVVGVDEHLVAPGAGFEWHAHRGVHIASWVLAGTLRHEDSNGELRLLTPGALLVQSTGPGIRHREWNASDESALRFVQITIVGEAEPGVRTATLPAAVAGVGIDVRPGVVAAGERRFVLALGDRSLVIELDPASSVGSGTSAKESDDA